MLIICAKRSRSNIYAKSDQGYHLRLINDNQKIGITNIQKYINTSADIVEQYISELIAESYLKYDSNKSCW